MLVMKLWGKTFFCLLVSAVLVLTASCSSTGGMGPTVPVQVPTTVESLGGETDGSLAVQTGKALNFVAKDASGEIVDPDLVVAQVITKDGEVLDYGSVASSEDQIVNMTENFFPNAESQYQINFYKNSADANLSKALLEDDLLARFDVDVTGSPEDMADETVYQFSDPVLLDTFDAGYPSIFVTEEHKIVYVCYRKWNWDCPEPSYEGCGIISTDLMFVKSEDNGKTWSDPSSIVHYDDDDNEAVLDSCTLTAKDSTIVEGRKIAMVRGEEKVAITFVTNQPGAPDGVSPAEGKNYRTNSFYVIDSDDGGDTFGTPLLVDAQPVDANNPDAVSARDSDARFDNDGLIHVIYKHADDESLKGDVFYAFCDTTPEDPSEDPSERPSCGGHTQVNSSSDSLGYSNTNFPMAVYTGTDSVKIYTIFGDDRNSEATSFLGIPLATTSIRMGEILYANGRAEVVRDVQIDSIDNSINVNPFIVLDRDNDPVVAWTYIKGGAAVDDIEYEVLMKKWSVETESFSSDIEVTSRSDQYVSGLGFMGIDDSGYLHFYYSNISTEGLSLQSMPTAALWYSMGHFATSENGESTFSIDTNRNTSNDLDVIGKSGLKLAQDRAGRLYATWYDDGEYGVPDASVYIVVGDIVTDSN